MAATTTISVFHHDRYTSCVVPAIRDLLRSGEPGPWLRAVWDHLQNRYPATAGRPFAFEPNGSDETQLDADLLPTATWGEEWFYLPADQTMERANLIDLFQHVVGGCCLGESASAASYHWSEFVDGAIVMTFELEVLLYRLREGARVWYDAGQGGLEGIRGWLNPDETAELARELHRIELPSRPPDPSQLNVSPTAYYEHDLLHSLFGVRRIAERAWELGLGVLCSTGPERQDWAAGCRFTASHPAYTTDTVQQLARAIRDRREFDVLPMLADALQEAGCENDVVLTHCRDANEHKDACWVADLILASEMLSQI